MHAYMIICSLPHIRGKCSGKINRGEIPWENFQKENFGGIFREEIPKLKVYVYPDSILGACVKPRSLDRLLIQRSTYISF